MLDTSQWRVLPRLDPDRSSTSTRLALIASRQPSTSTAFPLVHCVGLEEVVDLDQAVRPDLREPLFDEK